MSELLRDIWESDVSSEIKIEEALDSEGNKREGILAIVEGPAFFPDSVSRNKHRYTTKAWDVALGREEFNRRLRDRLVFGTIGHDLKVTDETLRQGLVSHIVEDVWINDQNVGMARYLILDTDPGKVLNTYLRAGSKLRVSTKARGLFENRRDNSGAKVVLPDTFILDRIDFVLEPGYLEAYPELLESLDPENQLSQTEESKMPEAENSKVIEILESQMSSLSKQLEGANGSVDHYRGQMDEIKESMSELKGEMKSYQELGSVSDIVESQSLLAKYREMGDTPEEISEALDKATAEIDRLNGIVQRTSGEVGASLQLEEANEALTKYKEFGTLDELEEMVEAFEGIVESKLDEEKTAIASRFDIEESVVDNFLDKGFTMGEIEESLTAIKPVSQKGRNTEKYKQGAGDDINEDLNNSAARMRRSTGLAGRLMSNRSK